MWIEFPWSVFLISICLNTWHLEAQILFVSTYSAQFFVCKMRDIYEQGTPAKKLQTGNLKFKGSLRGEGGHDNLEDEVDRDCNFMNCYSYKLINSFNVFD